MTKSRSRARRALWAAATTVAIVAIGGACYLRADKREVFRQVAGRFEAARVVEHAESGGQPARRVELVNHRGEAVASAWVRRPPELPETFRALLLYAGEKTGRRILELVPARDDLVLVAVQYPYERPRTLAGRLRWPYEVRRAAFRTVAGGMLAVSFLERDEGVDPSRLTVLGSSLGSAFAVAHAALDARVPRLVVVHGGGDLPLVVRALEARRGRPWRGRLYAAGTALLFASFEPLRYVGEIAPRETIVVAARSDQTFPSASTLALYERARDPKRLSWTSGAHLRSRPGAELEEVLAELDRVLGPPPAR
jgi:dienelactone hydrolase